MHFFTGSLPLKKRKFIGLEDTSAFTVVQKDPKMAALLAASSALAPLPGGCHGKTSRNQSFCRRQPCYNGSQFCKLHYQQDQRRLQDKRYTGKEPRCAATTTRGRACAYIAVEGTVYCNLHADYETNPPPRRGGIPTEVSVASTKEVKAATTTTSEEPLLSQLSTNLWKGQVVRIATGPLTDRIGKVEKWGNGWISVRVPGIGLHNRRSFELCLQPLLRCVSSPAPGSEPMGVPVTPHSDYSSAATEPPETWTLTPPLSKRRRI